MADRNKVWVIDSGKPTEVTALGDPLRTAPRPTLPLPPRPGVRPQGRPAPAPRTAAAVPARRRRPLHPAMLLALGYLLGPAALVLERRARGSVWAGLTAAWASATAALVLGWWALAGGRAVAELAPWLAGGTVAMVAAGFGLWARALGLVATGERVVHHQWSPRLTSPWSAVLLGLLAPGSAQVPARRAGHAAAVLAATGPFVAALLVAVQAPLLWTHRAGFGVWGLEPAAVERLLLAACLLAAVAPLLWLAQALEGARVLAVRHGRWQGMRGDWSAVALVAAVGAAVTVLEPVTIAAGLGEYADGLAAEGCTVAPLVLVRTAQRLDPGQPAYALQAADLYVAAGAPAEARRVRAALDRSLQPYLGALMREERRARAASPAAQPPAMPAAAASLLLPETPPVHGTSGPPAPVGPAPQASGP